MKNTLLILTFSIFALSFDLLAGDTLRVSGSTTVNPVVAEAAEHLREEKGLSITIDTAGGSTGGINALGDGRTDVAMASREITDKDRTKYPDVQFHPVHIGEDAVSIVVSKDVWESGVKSLSPQQMRGIYEGKITSWQELGGTDRRIVFFNKEPGRGTWEVFTKWLYGKSSAAPDIRHPEVGANAEVRSKVAGTRGAISFVSTEWADGKSLFALSIEQEGGELIAASSETLADGSYPLSRPLFVITNSSPNGLAKTLIDYLLTEEGQKLLPNHGYLKLSDLKGKS